MSGRSSAQRSLYRLDQVLAHAPPGRQQTVLQDRPADQPDDQAALGLVQEQVAHALALPTDQDATARRIFLQVIAGDNIQPFGEGLLVQEPVGIGRSQFIIAVAMDDVLPRRQGQSLHPGISQAAVHRHPENPDLGFSRGELAGEDLPDHLHGPVRRAVVDEDELQVLQRLGKQRPRTACDIGFHVVDRYDDADRGHVLRAKTESFFLLQR